MRWNRHLILYKKYRNDVWREIHILGDRLDFLHHGLFFEKNRWINSYYYHYFKSNLKNNHTIRKPFKFSKKVYKVKNGLGATVFLQNWEIDKKHEKCHLRLKSSPRAFYDPPSKFRKIIFFMLGNSFVIELNKVKSGHEQFFGCH